MTNVDLVQKIGDIVDEKINRALDEKLAASEQRLKAEMSASKHTLKKEIVSTEQRLKAEIESTEQRLKAEIAISDKRVLADIGSFMEDNLFPMIDEKADKADIARLEQKLDKALDSNQDHERRIRNIEHIPVIAHELKVKKTSTY